MGSILMGSILMGTRPDGVILAGCILAGFILLYVRMWQTGGDVVLQDFSFQPQKPGCRQKVALGASPAVSPPRGMPWGRCPLPGLLPQELRLGSTDLKHHKVWSREKNPRSRAGMCPLQRLLCAAASTVPEHGAAGTFVHQRHGHSRAKKIEFCFFFFFLHPEPPAQPVTATALPATEPMSWCPGVPCAGARP